MDKMISFTFPHGAFPKAAQPNAERDPPAPARDVSQGLRRTHGERVPSSLSGAGHCPRDTLLPRPSRDPEVLAGEGGWRGREHSNRGSEVSKGLPTSECSRHPSGSLSPGRLEQVYEKMLNITDPEGDADRSYERHHFTLVRMATVKTAKGMKCGQERGARPTWCAFGGKVNCLQLPWKTV